MTQNEKDLLLRDLCARLPYGVKAYVKNWSNLNRKWIEDVYTVKSVYPSLNTIFVTSELGSVEVILGNDDYKIEPYLFPISSMTEEQDKEFMNIQIGYPSVDWFNKNHIDYRGIIEKGLAIDATGKNIY